MQITPNMNTCAVEGYNHGILIPITWDMGRLQLLFDQAN